MPAAMPLSEVRDIRLSPPPPCDVERFDVPFRANSNHLRDLPGLRAEDESVESLKTMPSATGAAEAPTFAPPSPPIPRNFCKRALEEAGHV